MIKKLRQRVFFIIMVSLSIVVLGVIILFAFFNYNQTINTSTSMLNRFVEREPGREIEQKEKFDNDIDIDLNIDGVYSLVVEDSRVIISSDTTNNNELEQYAIKVSEGKKENGIMGAYIYKVIRNRGSCTVIFMENEEVILHARRILIFSGLGCIISLIIIYCVARKISKVIVKPIEETFDKQKQFISDASHELKTPLAVIEANTDVLENEIGDNKWLNYIQNETESMNKLINELLLLAKMENTDVQKEYKKFDISKEIEIIISMFESMAYEKKVILKSNIQQGITMTGNKEDIEHILSTLIDNAIKHTEESKEIIIELNENKNNIILQVKNMGEPIPEDEREKIFERFYRIDKSRNRSEKRYGLGLSIAKSTVQRYNGTIEALYKEGFTIFKVVIPVKFSYYNKE